MFKITSLSRGRRIVETVAADGSPRLTELSVGEQAESRHITDDMRTQEKLGAIKVEFVKSQQATDDIDEIDEMREEELLAELMAEETPAEEEVQE